MVVRGEIDGTDGNVAARVGVLAEAGGVFESDTAHLLAAAFPPMRREGDQTRLTRVLPDALARVGPARFPEHRTLCGVRVDLGPTAGLFVR
jgi:hypothetical protein